LFEDLTILVEDGLDTFGAVFIFPIGQLHRPDLVEHPFGNGNVSGRNCFPCGVQLRNRLLLSLLG
jgi:hypothetical protein